MTASLPISKQITLDELVLRYGPVELQSPLSRETFRALAERFPDLLMERDKNGNISIMSPVKKGSGKREFNLSGLFFLWHQKTKLGEFYSPSTGFDLPDGAIKSPDIAWISAEKLTQVPEESEEDFVKIVPDFVAEARSKSDILKKLQTKMTDTWMANGVRLAWLIDPYEDKVYIYRPGRDTIVVEGFADKTLSGEDIMPGFELPLETMKRN